MLELMIAVVVLAIGASLALPSFRELIRNSNVSTNTNDLVVAMNLARSEAIKRGTRVAVISASGTGDWSTGWSVKVDTARDGSYTTILRTREGVSTGYHVQAKATGAGGKDDRVVFDSAGGLTNGLTPPDMTNSAKPVTKVELNVCSQTTDKTKARYINVGQSGQISSRRDASASSVTASC